MAVKVKEFIVGTRRQEVWGWLNNIAEIFTGTGSGLAFISIILGSLLGVVAGFIVVLIGSFFLLIDVAHPTRAWRLISRAQSSWISRGTIGISVFLLLTFLYIIFLISQPDAWVSIGAPWVGGSFGAIVFAIVAAVAALFTAIYPGFLLGSMRPIQFWNGSYIPALFLTSALLGGLGLFYLLPVTLEEGSGVVGNLETIGIGIIIFELVLVLGMLWVTHPGVTQESIKLLTRGSLSLHFWLGVLGLGLVAPLVILGLVSLGAVTGLLFIAGVLLLLGMLLLRYLIFKVSIYDSTV